MATIKITTGNDIATVGTPTTSNTVIVEDTSLVQDIFLNDIKLDINQWEIISSTEIKIKIALKGSDTILLVGLPLKGDPGADGSDATVTAQAITDALTYTPADDAEVVKGVRKSDGTLLTPDINREVTLPEITGGMYANVMDFGAIGDGVVDDTLSIQNVINSNSQIYIPEGVYLVSSLTIPDNKRIHTDGLGTVIQQKQGVGQIRVIIINGGNVELGDITIKGNIATDTNEQNHGIFIRSTIKPISNIHLGIVKGIDIRGDIIYIGGIDNFDVEGWTIKGVVCDNIYRNGVSVTGGKGGKIGFITGNKVGFLMFDVEPNVNSTPCKDIQVGYIKGGEVGVIGYQTLVKAENIKIDFLDLSPAFQINSVPAYPLYDASNTAFLIRNAKGVHIGDFEASGYNEHIIECAFATGDFFSEDLTIDRINFKNSSLNEATYNAYILATAIRTVTINGGVVNLNAANKRLIHGASSGSILTEVNFSFIECNGQLAHYVTNSKFDNIKIDSTLDAYAFSQVKDSLVVNSNIKLGRLAGFCGKITFENVIATASTFLFAGTTDFFLQNTTLNTIYYKLGPYLRQHQNAYYFGGYYLWIDASGNLRKSGSTPTSDTSGSILVTETNVTGTARTYTAVQTHSVSPIVPPATQADHVPQFGQIPVISGATGSFTSADGKTITVINGLITSII